MKILLIEDDEILVSVLANSLTQNNYVVDIAPDGYAGWEYSQAYNYDLILIDVGLPKLDGISLCQRLRSAGNSTPILLITAKDATSDRIRGLDAGADDYLIKPLDLGELQARVRALLRRGDTPVSLVLEIGGLSLDPSSCEVIFNGKLLDLTPKEYSLLELFIRNPSRVFSRGNIIEHLWTFDDPPQEESVKSHIKGLRQKLKAVGAVDWIENVYGLGYRLHPAVKAAGEQRREDKPKLPVSNIQQQFNQAMSKLWHQYEGLMQQRMAVLQAAAAALSGELSLELRQSAEKEAHKLAGVLGMFELETGTQIAREIEQILGKNAKLSAAQKTQLRSQIQELGNLINLMGQNSNPTTTLNAEEISQRLLLIDPNPQLSSHLQQLVGNLGIDWQQITKLAEAKNLLQTTSPDLVVLNVSEMGHRQESLALLSDLATRTPPIPVVVLAADELAERVTLAQYGARGFLAQPVTAAQIWDVASQLLQRTHDLRVNVLVVDDDPVILAALRSMLEPWGMRVTALDKPLRFWELLQSTTPDLLILDVEMPDISGIELCQAVRTDPQWQELPIMFLTAHRDIETVQQVFAVGGDDYVIKPVVGAELLARINHRLERSRLLQSLSTKDSLTGLANQLQSSRDLQQLIIQAQKHQHSLCLAILSITDLRQINSKYGHETGNQVLQRWSRLFQSTLCSGEVLGYWGNGEFVIGFSGLTKPEVKDRLGNILTTLRQQIFTDANGDRFQAVCNCAVVEYPQDGQNIQSLYQAAIGL
ncbi:MULTISPECIES: response regulator [unclassified Tolypothrix]|uniref:response regulator n=1 Tax=unclassified Tolypothrix TaxID=2649714 RepID=UPI0005EAB205|nr:MULTISPECIES: response regulator [unclassified Tolypothrix]BAY89567.1 multi-component transcriptional regulator [Microchaete diplosiphon NIES-3275]EKF02542.1 response regulator [Tolypothrix sp. PCC 7601]MBE9085065.1 response regulator [Tolypothrix sp. LEGE 11397]UYD23845.1 response regulator [Tolypothrix sp. PCC 7712]UYD33930.1 response regulator [Tolypothrix sp. PCC 7601]